MAPGSGQLHVSVTTELNCRTVPKCGDDWRTGCELWVSRRRFIPNSVFRVQDGFCLRLKTEGGATRAVVQRGSIAQSLVKNVVYQNKQVLGVEPQGPADAQGVLPALLASGTMPG